MTEQEYIDVSDLRTWRIVKSVMKWLMHSDRARKINRLIDDEIARLESTVEVID